MNLLVVIGSDVHRNALRQARQIGKEIPLPPGRLHAPLDNETSTWVSQVWDVIEGAIQRAYHEGMDAARPLIEQASKMLADLTGGAVKHAQEIQTIIAERLNVYLVSAIDGALQRVRSSISIGGSELKLTNVTVEQRINMSGSLKASISEVCEFVAEGEISLSAEYGAAQ